MIRTVQLTDSSAIASIYNYYIHNTVITFEEEPIDSEEMKKRILNIISKFPWIVYENKGQVMGYAYAMDWKTRSAYKNSVEISIYLNPESTKRGIGTLLYKELLNQLSDMNLHAIIGGIALPNPMSIALHEKFGFEKIAHFKEIGFKFDKWVDVGYWQLLLEKK